MKLMNFKAVELEYFSISTARVQSSWEAWALVDLHLAVF